jgi:FMN phosphatase YigB (HAD superfamily)
MTLPVDAVFFDVGETLVDETGVWSIWADWLGVPRFTFFAAIGAVIVRGGDHREVFELFCPGRDYEELRRAREADIGPQGFTIADLYPDARSCLETLAGRGYRIGIAANQPARAQTVLEASGLPFEWLVISAVVGIDKPSPAFFAHLCELSGLPPERIAYVGDRADNDVGPAAAAGMVPIHVRRGPWAVIHARRPELALAALSVGSLAELPDRLDELGR